MTVLPFRETKRTNHTNLHEGPYYGHALRRVLKADPPRSKRDRDVQLAVLNILMVGLSIGLAVLIVSLGR